jgi:RimJ/RimL family protein N-acetyltransferase
MISKNGIGLRAIEYGDLEKLRDWRNLPDFRKNFREFRELNLADQEAWFKSIQSRKHVDFMFVIVNVDTTEVIGACGLLYVNWVSRYADFSFYIGKDEAYIDNEGMAQNAAELLIEYGYNTLNLNKLWMELYSFDHQKVEFFQALRFKIDGVLRENVFHAGKFEDSFILSLLRKESFVELK